MSESSRPIRTSSLSLRSFASSYQSGFIALDGGHQSAETRRKKCCSECSTTSSKLSAVTTHRPGWSGCGLGSGAASLSSRAALQNEQSVASGALRKPSGLVRSSRCPLRGSARLQLRFRHRQAPHAVCSVQTSCSAAVRAVSVTVRSDLTIGSAVTGA